MSDLEQEGEHEAELLLNRKKTWGITRYLVLWCGHMSADDESRWPQCGRRSSLCRTVTTR